VDYVPRRHAARSTADYVFHQLIPYLGNKRQLLTLIGEALAHTGVVPARATFVDAFAGSGVVARYAKQLGFAVVANDWEPFALALNTAAIACDRAPAFAALGGYERALEQLEALPGVDGWITRTWCPADDAAPDPTKERLFYRRATGRRLDAIRERIATWRNDGTIDGDGEACLLAPLLYQACFLSNTSGVFKGFHAGWGGRNATSLHRILEDLSLVPQRFFDNGRRHHATAVDARHLAGELASRGVTADVVYLDPPYNQHPYASNYHVLHSLTVWDRPELPPPTERGHRAGIRRDWTARKSAFNSRLTAAAALADVFDRLDAPHVLLSYSEDGLIPLERLLSLASAHGAVRIFCRRYKRYRTSPTRPSPRPSTVEFVLAIDRTKARSDDDVGRALETVASAGAPSSSAPHAAAPGQLE
jgi:adenine-specific DNA-methyltransferase